VSDDLVQFLRARLDEDEQVARDACHGGPAEWTTDDSYPVSVAGLPPGTDVFARAVAFDEGSPSESQAAHIARHDPARVLAEAEAKRMLLDSIVPTMNAFEDRIDEEWGTSEGEHASAAFLRAWARVHRDHPDFDPAWLED
jgi:hypothetical protein